MKARICARVCVPPDHQSPTRDERTTPVPAHSRPPPQPPHIPVCAPGFGASALGACQKCAAGTFSVGGNSTSKRPSCTSCPVGFTSNVTGATSASSCTNGEVPGRGTRAVTVWGAAAPPVRAERGVREQVRTPAARRCPLGHVCTCDVQAHAGSLGCGPKHATPPHLPLDVIAPTARALLTYKTQMSTSALRWHSPALMPTARATTQPGPTTAPARRATRWRPATPRPRPATVRAGQGCATS